MYEINSWSLLINSDKASSAGRRGPFPSDTGNRGGSFYPPITNALHSSHAPNGPPEPETHITASILYPSLFYLGFIMWLNCCINYQNLSHWPPDEVIVSDIINDIFKTTSMSAGREAIQIPSLERSGWIWNMWESEKLFWCIVNGSEEWDGLFHCLGKRIDQYVFPFFLTGV